MSHRQSPLTSPSSCPGQCERLWFAQRAQTAPAGRPQSPCMGGSSGRGAQSLQSRRPQPLPHAPVQGSWSPPHAPGEQETAAHPRLALRQNRPLNPPPHQCSLPRHRCHRRCRRAPHHCSRACCPPQPSSAGSPCQTALHPLCCAPQHRHHPNQPCIPRCAHQRSHRCCRRTGQTVRCPTFVPPRASVSPAPTSQHRQASHHHSPTSATSTLAALPQETQQASGLQYLAQS
mmetsp:Transcript_37404/g.88897  ORF Transcript_37404/g.88897 Transcript_37404/m.88897 type:complete len:231 (-) Transcript_37404:530-1222(-)